MLICDLEGSTKKLLILKHLEKGFFNGLDSSRKKKLKELYIIGVYYGFYQASFDLHEDFDFVIAANGVLPEDSSTKSISILPRSYLSGFNFIPDEAANTVCIKKNDQLKKIVYVGDLSARKNIKEAFRFFWKVVRNRHDHTLKLICRVGGYTDRIVLNLISLLINKYDNLEVLFPKGINNFSRADVFKYLGEADYVFVPYTKEGAARIIAEAECLGKPVLYNTSMKGGSGAYLIESENHFFANQCFSLPSLSNIATKSRDEKARIYCAKYSYAKFQKFIEDNFNCLVAAEYSEFINGFSGHKNVLPSQWTNEFTDEVRDMKSFANFLNANAIEPLHDSVSANFQEKFKLLLRRSKVYAVQLVYKLTILKVIVVGQ